jgi:hypothetical protein
VRSQEFNRLSSAIESETINRISADCGYSINWFQDILDRHLDGYFSDTRLIFCDDCEQRLVHCAICFVHCD